EALGQQKQIHEEQLQDNGVCRDTVFVLAAEQSQQPMIFTHGHRDTWPNPGHRTDCGYEAETNHGASKSPTVFAKNMLSGNQGHLKLPLQFISRSGRDVDSYEYYEDPQ